MHMSNPTGFDYEVMISRLHGGLCAFQSLRAHRRERAQAAAPPPATEARRTPDPPPAARVAHVDDLADLRATASLEPQAYVAVGDRVVPLFGNVSAGLFGGAAAGPATTPTDPPATPSSAPAPAAAPATPPAPAAEIRPSAPAATLRLPPPTPPAQLGLILGGRPPTPEPGAVTEPPTAIRPQDSDAPPTAVAASAASITALLDARAQEDAERLERAQAAHHAAMATLLREHQEALRAQSEADATRTKALLRDVFTEHRAELRAQSEAGAARTAALLRDVFAEHRAELAQVNQAHTDQLAQVLAQRPQSADPSAADTMELRAALLEQANVQREANEAVAEHIDALTSIIADLGQTVGMLAVAATQKAQQAQRSVQAIFPLPPRVEPATARAAAPAVDPAPSRPAVPHVDPAATATSATSPHLDPAATATSATSPHLEPANCGPSAAASRPIEPDAPASTQATPAAAKPPSHASLADVITSESPQPRSIGLKFAEEAAAHARVERLLAEDDDPDIETDDDDDPDRHRRLAPCTDIVGTAGEPGDD
jgi:hypothetical protein